jgi:hypothetical protein
MTTATVPYTPIMHGKYRHRTWLRGHLPWLLASRIPKGRDCGLHEWYYADWHTWHCYHCQAETHEMPWTPEEHLQYTFGGLNAMLRTIAVHRGDIGGQELAELHRLVAEAREGLGAEQERLGMLATAPPAELASLIGTRTL